MSKRIHCPTCGKPMEWDKTNPYRPFCSQRCKLIDLGEWASENRRINGEITESTTADEDNKAE